MKKLVSEDETWKFIFKTLKERFHRRLGYKCEKIEILNPELIPPGRDHKYMDTRYKVDGKSQHNTEFQSTAIYSPKLNDIFKYEVYSLTDEFTEYGSTVFATYPPTQGIEEIEIGNNITFHPDFFYTKNLKASEIIKSIKTKINNNEALTDNEAIDLIITPDTEHDCDIKELLKTTTELLINATIPNEKFYNDLLKCQKKQLQRFLKKEDREEIEKMINFRAEKYGIEPNVTGIEEEINLAYLDGEREGYDDGYDIGKKDGYDDGKQEGYNDSIDKTAKALIQEGCDDKFIAKITKLDIKTIQELRKK